LPKEKSGGFSLWGWGAFGPSKQDTQIIEFKKQLETKDSELLGLNYRINDMWNQMKKKFPNYNLP
jgi:hypothetical protein